MPETLQVLLTAPGVRAAFVDDKKARDQKFSAACLAALAPLYAGLFKHESKMHAAETARTAATRGRVLAYNALTPSAAASAPAATTISWKSTSRKPSFSCVTPSHPDPAVVPVPPKA